ncbi:MAG: hypothetical protein R3213_10320 [Flavobacteriaceae bacterium]|nr:hypothetical protein [Flavobacteriaceae bacterium]
MKKNWYKFLNWLFPNRRKNILIKMMNDNQDSEYDLKRLYDWLMDENREPANTKFTAGMLRNVAREIEYRLKNGDN